MKKSLWFPLLLISSLFAACAPESVRLSVDPRMPDSLAPLLVPAASEATVDFDKARGKERLFEVLTSLPLKVTAAADCDSVALTLSVDDAEGTQLACLRLDKADAHKLSALLREGTGILDARFSSAPGDLISSASLDRIHSGAISVRLASGSVALVKTEAELKAERDSIARLAVVTVAAGDFCREVVTEYGGAVMGFREPEEVLAVIRNAGFKLDTHTTDHATGSDGEPFAYSVYDYSRPVGEVRDLIRYSDGETKILEITFGDASGLRAFIADAEEAGFIRVGETLKWPSGASGWSGAVITLEGNKAEIRFDPE